MDCVHAQDKANGQVGKTDVRACVPRLAIRLSPEYVATYQRKMSQA